MRFAASVAILAFAPASACAQGPKPCETLKAEIAKKLDAANVKAYTLDIVAKDKTTDGKVVGTCEAGAKKIVYTRTAAPQKASTPAAGKR